MKIAKSVQINKNLQVIVFKAKQIFSNFNIILIIYWRALENILTNVKYYKIVESNESKLDYYSKTTEC